MKKLISLTLVCVLLLASLTLFGCDEDIENLTDNGSTAPETTEAAPTVSAKSLYDEMVKALTLMKAYEMEQTTTAPDMTAEVKIEKNNDDFHMISIVNGKSLEYTLVNDVLYSNDDDGKIKYTDESIQD